MIFEIPMLIILAIGAVSDVVCRRVPGTLTVFAILVSLFYSIIFFSQGGLHAFGGGLVMALVWLLPWKLNIIGGGDHKFFIISGFIVGFKFAIITSVFIALFGSGVSLVYAFFNRASCGVPKKITVPYTLAIFGGTFFVFWMQKIG